MENALLRAGFLGYRIDRRVLGFGGMAFAAAGIAKILFFVFLVIFVVTLLSHLLRGGTAGN